MKTSNFKEYKRSCFKCFSSYRNKTSESFKSQKKQPTNKPLIISCRQMQRLTQYFNRYDSKYEF